MTTAEITYHILNKVSHHHENPPSAKLIFIELPELGFPDDGIAYRAFLEDMEGKSYIKVTGPNKDNWGWIRILPNGNDYVNEYSQPPTKANTINHIETWEYFLRGMVDKAVRYTINEASFMVMEMQLTKARQNWELFKKAFRERKLSMNETERGNFYTDLKNDFYPIANLYFEWYNKNVEIVNKIRPLPNSYSIIFEFCKDTINEIDKLTIAKTARDYWAEEREKIIAKGKEKEIQDEIRRKQDFATYISPTYDYSPTVKDFIEEMTVQKANNADKYLLFLRETKKVYMNSKSYYQVWGARGTGYDRHDIDMGIINLINPELEKEIALELVRNKDPFADGTLDLNGHIEWLNRNLLNLELVEHKVIFLNAEKEKTKKYIEEKIKGSSKQPTLEISGVRAERIKVATKFLNEITKRINEIENPNVIPPTNGTFRVTPEANSENKQPAISFDYANKEGYFFSDRIDDFKAIEDYMMRNEYFTKSGKWDKEKKYLVAFIHIIYRLKYMRPKIGKKDEKNTRLEYRRFFERRYKTNVTQEMKPAKFPIGKLNQYKPDFHFITDIDKL